MQHATTRRAPRTPRACEAAALTEPRRATRTKASSCVSVIRRRTYPIKRLLISALNLEPSRSGARTIRHQSDKRGKVDCRFQPQSSTSTRPRSPMPYALLERHGPDARLIAGGHSIIPMMKLRLARPEVLVDINDLLTSSAYVHFSREGDGCRIGAMARHP